MKPVRIGASAMGTPVGDGHDLHHAQTHFAEALSGTALNDHLPDLPQGLPSCRLVSRPHLIG